MTKKNYRSVAFQSLLILAVFNLNACGEGVFGVQTETIYPDRVINMPDPVPVPEPEPEPIPEPEPEPIPEPEPEPIPEPEPEPEPEEPCEYSYDPSRKTVEICSGEDIEKLRAIIENGTNGLTIYFMRNINLADGHETSVVDGNCTIDNWESLPTLSNTEISTPDNKTIRITASKDGSRCSLEWALFSELNCSSAQNLWLDYDIMNYDAGGTAAFVNGTSAVRFENITFSGTVKNSFEPEPDTGYLNSLGGIVNYDYSGDGERSEFINTVCKDAVIEGPDISDCGCVLGSADSDVYISTWPGTNKVKSLHCQGGGGMVGFFTQGTIENSMNEVDEIKGVGWLGGLTGCIQYATFRNVRNHVNKMVSTSDDPDWGEFGGLVGYAMHSTIENVETVADYIKGTGLVGGAIGSIEQGGTFSNIISRANLRINEYNDTYPGILSSGFVGSIATFLTISFENISVWRSTDPIGASPLFAGALSAAPDGMIENKPAVHILNLKNIAAQGFTDQAIGSYMSIPMLFDGSDAYGITVNIDDVWYDDTDSLGFACYEPKWNDQCSKIDDREKALNALNQSSSVTWKLEKETLNGYDESLLSFDLPEIVSE